MSPSILSPSYPKRKRKHFKVTQFTGSNPGNLGWSCLLLCTYPHGSSQYPRSFYMNPMPLPDIDDNTRTFANYVFNDVRRSANLNKMTSLYSVQIQVILDLAKHSTAIPWLQEYMFISPSLPLTCRCGFPAKLPTWDDRLGRANCRRAVHWAKRKDVHVLVSEECTESNCTHP